jgi:RNase P/RNase MRP subunit POP5
MLKRFKRRYLALKIDSEFDVSDRELIDSIWGAVTRLYGEVGASLSNLVLIDHNCEQKLAILRCNLAVVNETRTAVATIISILEKPAAVHVLAISGTIKALREKLSAH